MAPPSYADLGKQARDLFNKGYNFGVWKLDFKTKIDCLKLTFEGSFESQSSNSKIGKFEVSYSHDLVQVNSDVNLDFGQIWTSRPVINASAVVGREGWLAGIQTAFDTQKAKFVTNKLALDYTNKDIAVTTNVNDSQEFYSSIYYKVNSSLATGVRLSWASGSSAIKFGIGAQYTLGKDASVRAKVNNARQIGLGYQQGFRDGVTLTLSILVDGKNFNAGAHKIGIGLELGA